MCCMYVTFFHLIDFNVIIKLVCTAVVSWSLPNWVDIDGQIILKFNKLDERLMTTFHKSKEVLIPYGY